MRLNGASTSLSAASICASSSAGAAVFLAYCRGGQARAAAEDQQIRKRISAEAVRAVQSARRFARRKKSGHGGLPRFRVHANAAHHVVARRAHFHRPLGDVHVREFLELVIHARQFPLHVFGGLVRNIEKRAAVRSAAAFLHFRVDRARHHVARGKLHALRIVLLHEALAIFVAQDAAFAAHRFGDENSLHSRRPDHSRGMELHEFHVEQFGAGFVRERHAVAGALPGIRSDLPGFSDAAGGDHDGLRLENDEAAALAPVAERARDAVAIFQQARDGAFHENVEAHLHAAILQRANHFEAGAVADVAEALVGVAAERALQNVAVVGAVEKRAPLLEFADAVGRFLRVKLRHAPVVQEFSAAHRVAEMRAPVVGFIDVGHRGGEAAFGHHGVRFAEQRLADHADARALRQRFDARRAVPRRPRR